MSMLAIILICLVLSTLMVAVHHETLMFITSGFLPRFSRPRRWHVGATVMVLMAAHIAEIMIFGIGLYVAGEYWNLGGLFGTEASRFHTYMYFSFSSYTSLGIGDVFPTGHLRYMSGVEALLGLVMIGWTASFLFLEMRTYWSVHSDK
ncbi:MAG: two pore domain potassium channel family protein [Granulosicoccus sp.]|nr:two pore domain potassium channel family protein [Granulosicoccus sp.]